ncbi:MAG: DUF4384 domain-containing protein [Treponema sp.]|jgi:TolB-like protein|nr:DUF4384 domain-containing protein [Treponema sp.]
MPAPVPTADEGISASYSPNSLTLDGAIDDSSSYFIERLPRGVTLAIVSFETASGGLSDYIFEELWGRFEHSGKFVMVDRRNLERIRTEMNYQMSGQVNDESARSIGRQYGAQYILYGQLTSLGDEYRLVIYATDIETASSSQRAHTVKPDNRLSSLLRTSLDDQISRAVTDMARGLDTRLTIAVGRISYTGTQTVSSLSAYLKNGISASAHRQQGRFLVASDSESAEFAVATRGLTVETPVRDSPIQAVVMGNFSPVDQDAEVSLQLVSTGENRVVLGSAGFVIPAGELERRKLSLLPEKDTGIISQAEFEAKQQAVDPYAGRNNRFTFTVSPDDLDGIYYEGEYMIMRIYAERDCYFRIVHVDVNGTAQVIYPTDRRDNNFIRAGETRRIPDNTRFRMGAPFGEEYILVAAYDQPFTLGSAAGGDRISDAAIGRGLIVESGAGTDNGSPISPVATAKFSYTILPGH